MTTGAQKHFLLAAAASCYSPLSALALPLVSGFKLGIRVLKYHV